VNFLQSALGDDPLVVMGRFDAPVERVFRAWTDPDEITKWFGRNPNYLVSASIDLRPGGKWRFVMEQTETQMTAFEGEYLDIQPNSKLAFTWSHVTETAAGERQQSPASQVSVEFETTDTGTRVLLRHEQVASADARTGIGHGWDRSFDRLSGILSAE